uniref:Eukaryotic translation initiation factor 3 subunit L n=1 Tax=Romanomermis culicivorax TaxID=13658 RepID=A0A915JA07_ROMCU
PEEVCEYLRYFKRCVREQNVHEIQNLYDFGFTDLTERYYREKLWPDEDRVRMIIPDDQDTNFFMILYKELYYRYLYGKIPRGPSLEHRWNSFQNYQALFSYILNPTEPVKLDLPNQWLWDIIDEFVYQFQSFCQYKSSVNKRTKEEIEDLKTMDEQLWNLYPVLNILYSLVSKSQINLQLRAALDGEDVSDSLTEFGSHPLYYRLGYFSLIGLCRLHVLLGDYFQALKTIENLQFNAQEIYNSVPTCSVALHYYVGFCHMMARRYQETVQLFVACLMFIQRTRGIQYQQQQKSWQYDITSKTADQMYNLLAICLILQPQRIDESVQSQLNEKFSEKMNRMGRGELSDFESAFQMGCPKFLLPTVPSYDVTTNFSKEPSALQCRVFMEEVKQQITIPILRGFLKLYTTLPVSKLSSFVEIKEEDLISGLLSFKHKMYDASKADSDMINVADTKVARRYGEYFVKHIQKLMELNKTLSRINVGGRKEQIGGPKK